MQLAKIKPGSPEHEQLHKHARTANEEHKELLTRVQKLNEDGAAALSAVMIIGDCFNKAKALLHPSEWEFWVKSQCPIIGVKLAEKYIKKSINPKQLEERNPVAQLLMFFTEDSKAELVAKPQFEPSPAWMTVYDKFAGSFKALDREPLTKWPEGARQQIKEDLEPFNEQLWPGFELWLKEKGYK